MQQMAPYIASLAVVSDAEARRLGSSVCRWHADMLCVERLAALLHRPPSSCAALSCHPGNTPSHA